MCKNVVFACIIFYPGCECRIRNETSIKLRNWCLGRLMKVSINQPASRSGACLRHAAIVSVWSYFRVIYNPNNVCISLF